MAGVPWGPTLRALARSVPLVAVSAVVAVVSWQTGANGATVGSPMRSSGAPAGVEVAAMRTEFSQTRRLAGGVFETTLSSQPLNFRDAAGQWRRIDNELVRAADGSLENRANSVDVGIPKTAAGDVRFADGDSSVSFSLAGAAAAAVDVDGETAEFADVVDGVDVEYEAEGKVLKETLTLASSDAPVVYRFDVDAGGLRPDVVPSGDVAFVDGAGRQQLGFAAPWMKDADGVVSRAARYEVVGRDRVVLRLDERWLRDPARRFPVVVDPTVYSSMGHVCEIRNGSRSNTTYCDGAATDLWVGRDAGGIVYRDLFALQDLSEAVPAYAQVLDSWVEVRLSGQTPVEASEIDLHHLMRGFAAPGATWNRSNSRALWTRPGGDFDPQRITRVSTGTAPPDGWMLIDMTELAQSLVARAEPSPNLLLKAADESRTHIDMFDGADVRIRWGHRTGISPQHTYETRELSDGSTLSLNMANTNLVLSSNDIDLETDDGRFTVGRYFNSLNLADGETTGSFGPGSRGDFGSITLERYWLNGSYVFSGPGGETGVFQKRSDGTFSPPAGIDAVLTELPDHTATVTFNDTTETWTFDADGRLIQTRQDYGYTIDGTYGADGLATLRDTSGHTATFGYDGVGDLRTITDQDAAIHRYDFDGTHRLISYTSPVGAQTRYTYDGLERLTRISLPDRTALRIAYHGDGYMPSSITPVDAAGVDQLATTYSGEMDWTEVIRPSTPRKVYFFDRYNLLVDLIQTGDDAAISATGLIPDLADSYTKGDVPLSVDVSAAQARQGVQLIQLKVDGVEVDSIGAAPCDWSTCPTRSRERLGYDPTLDPEGTYEYRVRTILGDNSDTFSPPWRIAIDRTGPTSSATAFQAFFEDQTDETTVVWEAGTSPELPDGTQGAPIVRYDVRYQLNAGGWSGWQQVAQPHVSVSGTTVGAVLDVEVRAIDAAGNIGAVSTTTLTIAPQEPEEPLPPTEALTPDEAASCDSYQAAIRSRDPDAPWMCIRPTIVRTLDHDPYHWDFAWMGRYGSTRYPLPIGMVQIDARVALRNGSLSYDEMSIKAVGGAPIRPELRINCRYVSDGDSCGDFNLEYFRYTTSRIYNRDIIKHAWGRRYRHHFNFYWRAQGFRNPTHPQGKWHAVPIPISDTFICRKYRYECVFQ